MMRAYPGQRLQRRDVTHRHVVGAVRSHAEAPEREAGEARALAEHHVEVLDGHRLGLGDAVYVDELRQHVADALRAQGLLGLLGFHRSSLSLKV
jgi:hypothetical protein